MTSRTTPAPRITPAVIFAAALLAVTGCAPATFAADPRLATDAGARPQGQSEPTTEQSGPPPLQAPRTDLAWHDCTVKTFGEAAVPPTPGVRLDCASYEADLDPVGGGSSGSSAISIGVVRARSVRTPASAGPVVFTTGWDMPSSLQLPVWLSRAGADVLDGHPVVAVDRRGIGTSSPVDCRTRTQREEMWSQAQFRPGDDRVANLTDIATRATTDCTDSLAPGESSYDNTHAATDLERLRNIWDIPGLALIGIGNGAQIALSYAASHPGKVSRMVLDSPIVLGVSAEDAAEQRVQGQQASLDAFVAQCRAIDCALGPDPLAAVDGVLGAARSGRGPGGASEAAVARAISVALGFPNGDRVTNMNDLAKALDAARSGDANLLTNLINRAEAIEGTDGRFVNSCADAIDRPTPDRVRELLVAWRKEYPQFGTVGALELAQCLSWPTSASPQQPDDLSVDALLLGVQNDPIVGSEGTAATAATVINAEAASKRVMWQGVGHGASIYTSCAMPPLTAYLATGKLPDTDVYCPA